MLFSGTCRNSFHPLCAREAGHRMEVWARYGCDNVILFFFLFFYGVVLLLLISSDFALILGFHHKCLAILSVFTDRDAGILF